MAGEEELRRRREVIQWLEERLAEERAELEEAIGKPKREPSSALKLFDDLEFWRQERCNEDGIEPKLSKRPHPAKLNAAIERLWPLARYTPDPASPTYTREVHFEQLFKLYLAEEFGRYNEREDKPRDPPWPIELFLTPSVFSRYAYEYQHGKLEPWRPAELRKAGK